jgi:teichuronic acid exporter
MALVSMMVLARYLGPQAWGTFAGLALIVAVAELFIGPAVAEALLQRADGRSNHYDAVFWLLSLLAAVLALVIAGLAAPLSLLFGVPAHGQLLLALALLLPIAAVNGLYQTILQVQGRGSELAIVSSIAMMAGSAAGLAAALADQGLWSLFAMRFATSISFGNLTAKCSLIG